MVRDLPPVVFVSLDAAGRRWKLGHFARSSWRYSKTKAAHEIAISPALFETPQAVLATLLHEATHALLYERTGAGGCSKDHYYHRSTFRNCCRDVFGLPCEFWNSRYGFTNTGWDGRGVPGRYQTVLGILSRGLPWGTTPQVVPDPPVPKKLPVTGHVRLVCGCKRSVYVSRKTSQEGAIICGCCKHRFK
jgi:hypothetical protein